MDWKVYEDELNAKNEKAFEWLNNEFFKLRTSRITPNVLDHIKVEAYDELMPINQLANVSSPEARVLIIKAYDASVYKNIAAAINASDLNVNPQIDADKIRLSFPALTEDARKDIVKKAKSIAEDAKIKIRRNRQDIHDKYRKDDELSDDNKKNYHNLLDKNTKLANEKIEAILDAKTKDILTI